MKMTCKVELDAYPRTPVRPKGRGNKTTHQYELGPFHVHQETTD